jgi:hypothetical protein
MTLESSLGSLALALTLLLVVAIAPPANAQKPTGALYGSVSVPSGEPLPGVTVELSGIGAPRSTTTNDRGEFHFLGLDPGGYTLRAGRDGFSTVEYERIDIRIARNTTIELQLLPEIEEVITVIDEPPLLDQRKVARGMHVTRDELEAIPTARDPWAIVNQAPGVMIDRIDVGGSRGHQAIFTALGVGMEENDYQLDGVQITDMAATGSSSTYYDFDQFQEIQLATGGSDITKVSAGVTLNMVTKRGSNEPRGTARFFVTDKKWQSSPDVDARDFPPGQEVSQTDELDRLEDYGLELGGPVRKDRVWLWGAWAKNPIRELTTGGLPRETEIETAAIKANAQIGGANSAIASWHRAEKLRFRWNAGPGVEDEATWDQDSSTSIFKLQDTHVVGSSLMVSGTYSRVDSDARWVGRGGIGPSAPEALLDSDGVRKRNVFTVVDERPSQELRLEGSYFFHTGGASHELKFGGRRRDFDFESDEIWPGRQLRHMAGNNIGFPDGPQDIVIALRAGPQSMSTDYSSLWVQDTLAWERWTLNLGLRYDLQKAENGPSAAEANPAFPDLLPAIEFSGNDGGGFEWETVSPRIGATYALTRDRQTLLRASLARFPEVLGTREPGRINPMGSAQAVFLFLDLNDNNIWDGPGEPTSFLFPQGFDPADPTALDSPNLNDPGLDPALTDEIVLEIEHAFLPELVVGLNLTYRDTSDHPDLRDLIRDGSGEVRVVTREDYIQETVLTGTLPDGTSYSQPVYALRPGLSFTGGSLMTTGDRKVKYRGVALSAVKRLSNRWMLRGFLNYAKTDWRVPDSFFDFQDPTNLYPGERQDDDRQPAMEIGIFSDFLHSTWMFNVNGLYQVAPEKSWGFDLSANIYAREGYPLPYYRDYVSRIDGRQREVQAVRRVDDFRTDDIATVDLRLSKDFSLVRDQLLVTLMADLFNALNEGYVMRRELALNSPRSNFVESTLSPRVWRFGVRLSWWSRP